jgi:hypothetical protein
MVRLKRIFVIHTTATDEDAESDAGFQIQVVAEAGDFIRPFPDLPHDDRERGRTDQHEFVIPNSVVVDTLDPNFEIRMRMTTSNDGWHPSSIWVLGATMENQIILLGAYPEWGERRFDRPGNPPDTLEEHVISSKGNIGSIGSIT